MVRKFIPASSSTKESTFALSASNKHRWRVMECVQASSPAEDLSTSNPSTKTLKSKTISGSSYSPSSRIKNVTNSVSLEVERDATRREAAAATGLVMEVVQNESVTNDMGTGTQPVEDSKECFPMGYRGETRYEDGWIDFACGPTIDIVVTFESHLHDTERVMAGNELRQAPSVMNVEIGAPVVMLRVFGFLAPVILAIKVWWKAGNGGGGEAVNGGGGEAVNGGGGEAVNGEESWGRWRGRRRRGRGRRGTFP